MQKPIKPEIFEKFCQENGIESATLVYFHKGEEKGAQGAIGNLSYRTNIITDFGFARFLDSQAHHQFGLQMMMQASPSKKPSHLKGVPRE